MNSQIQKYIGGLLLYVNLNILNTDICNKLWQSASSHFSFARWFGQRLRSVRCVLVKGYILYIVTKFRPDLLRLVADRIGLIWVCLQVAQMVIRGTKALHQIETPMGVVLGKDVLFHSNSMQDPDNDYYDCLLITLFGSPPLRFAGPEIWPRRLPSQVRSLV